MRAKLRVCASCEWIFSDGIECPKCQFGSYGARYVYGNKAYRYAISQQPWLEKKMSDYAFILHQEIKEGQPKSRARVVKFGFLLSKEQA